MKQLAGEESGTVTLKPVVIVPIDLRGAMRAP